MTSRRKWKLIETARDLFYRDGFHATGIDTILAEAGVAKMTLYNHFRSKDDLIVAVLRHHHQDFYGWLRRGVQRLAETPRSQLLALFDVLKAWFASEGFRGCLIINAAAEFEGSHAGVHDACSEHKAQILAYIRELAATAGAGDSARLARQIYLLTEGAIVAAQISRRPEAADEARIAAQALIDAAIPR